MHELDIVIPFKRKSELFYHSFTDHFSTQLSGDWTEELYNYYVMGLEPCSFHLALLKLDLTLAVHSTHPLNQWEHICGFVKWLEIKAPRGSYGDHESISNWLDLTKEQRHQELYEAGLLWTDEEVLLDVIAHGL